MRGGPRSKGRSRTAWRAGVGRHAGSAGAGAWVAKVGSCTGAAIGAMSTSNATVMQQPGAQAPVAKSGSSPLGVSSAASLCVPQRLQHDSSAVPAGTDSSSSQHDIASTAQHSPTHAFRVMWLPSAANTNTTSAIQRIVCDCRFVEVASIRCDAGCAVLYRLSRWGTQPLACVVVVIKYRGNIHP